MMTMTPHSLALVLSTTGDIESATMIANQLIAERLAACVQITGPLQSVYRWQNSVETATEYRLMIKTSLHCWERLRDRLKQLHPYDEPQIVMLAIDDAVDGYRQWVINETLS